MNKQARTLHGLAEQARETGQLELALLIIDKAMIEYQNEGDMTGMAEVLASRSLTLRHLADKTGEKAFRQLAVAEMRAAVEIAPGVMTYYNLAKVEEDLGNLDAALVAYKEAVRLMETNPPKEHNRPAVLCDIKAHMGVCELRNGDKSAEARIVSELEKLADCDEPRYNKDVWISGGFLSLAELTGKQEYLEKAGAIIEANPELTLRKGQLEKLKERLLSQVK